MEKLNIITHENPKSPIAEAYRTLRTNIQFSSLDNPLKTIMVTSSAPGEGKTTTTVNLAVAMAQSDARVIIIDGDLRKPRIHKVFKSSNQYGVSNILVNNLDYKDVVIKTPINGLEILPSGIIPPNPSELLSSNKMKALINKLKEDYDYVLIDTPPAAVVTDAAILSTCADGVLLVCAAGQVSKEAVQRSRELLKNVNANILGVVLNKIPANNKGYYQYYYEDYYGEEEAQGRRKKKAKANG